MKENILWAVFIIDGFLLGSVMFSRIIPLALRKVDVCEVGSDGNPGAFNVFKSCGAKIGFLCLALDILKGALPVFLATIFLDTDSPLFSVVILAPVLGHAIAPLNGFKGGKCIATSFGVMLGLIRKSFVGGILAALYILFSAIIKIKPNRRCSIVTFSLFAVLSLLYASRVDNSLIIGIGTFMVAVVALLKHLIPNEKEDSIREQNSEETILN